jgi:multimeric flavodoxin WrbA
MKIIGINGSPRKSWNTATLVIKALEGAAAQGAATELVHLYDLDFQGCRSCFACKTKGGKSFGVCGMNDGLSPVLKKIADADALVIGSPIYLGSVTGETRSFLERLVFPYLTYTVPIGTLSPRKIATAFMYTMNSPEERSKTLGYEYVFKNHEHYLRTIFGSCESLCCFDTYQFDDYSKVLMETYDPVKKAARRKDAFPQDCRNAYELGTRLVPGQPAAKQ